MSPPPDDSRPDPASSAVQMRDTLDALQAVVDCADDAIFLKDAEGRFVLFNRAAERFSGFSAAQVLGKTAVEVFGPVTGGVMMAHERSVLERGEPTTVEETLTMQGVGRVFLNTRSPRRNSSGEIIGLVGVSRDITHRKNIENELRAHRERLILAARLGGMGIWDYHIDTSRLYCDERGYQILGLDPTHPIRSVADVKPFIHDEDWARATTVDLVTLTELLSSEKDYSTLFRIIRPDGEIRWLRSAACLVEGNAGVANRAIGMVTDVTETHLAAEALREAKESAEAAERSKSDFLATMSHEIRTPMSAMMGMTRLTLQTDLSGQQRNYLEKIDSSSKRLLAIINDILDFSKIEAGHLELENIPFALGAVLESVKDVTGLRAQEKGLAVMYQVADGVPPRLLGDPLRLSQVLTNLVGNAIKFTEAGGVTVSVTVVSMTATPTLRFAVRDTGIGLSPEQLSGLFRPFAQADARTSRRYGGTGLGLTICKRIVDQMGGRIEVESQPGLGSVFQFTVSLSAAPGTSQPTSPACIDLTDPRRRQDSPRTWPTLSGRRVLVVDDNALNREIAVDLLALVGVRVDTASSGAEAVGKIGGGDRYDAVLMDMHMPDMGGLETARLIRVDPTHRTLPIIALTAQARVEDRGASLEAGLEAHLTKPIDDALLYETLARVLGANEVSPPDGVASDGPRLALAKVLQRVNGDEARLERLLRGFRRDFSDAPEELAASVQAGAFSQVTLLAHTVKSAAGYLGAAALIESAGKLESAARASNRDATAKWAPAFATELRRVLGEIDALRADWAASRQMPLDLGAVRTLLRQLDPLLASADYAAYRILAQLALQVRGSELVTGVEELRQQFEDLEIEAARATLLQLDAALGERSR